MFVLNLKAWIIVVTIHYRLKFMQRGLNLATSMICWYVGNYETRWEPYSIITSFLTLGNNMVFL